MCIELRILPGEEEVSCSLCPRFATEEVQKKGDKMMDLERKFSGASALADFEVPVPFAATSAKVGYCVGKGCRASAGGECSEYNNCSGDMGQLRVSGGGGECSEYNNCSGDMGQLRASGGAGECSEYNNCSGDMGQLRLN
jgi:hypothetical protein